MSLSELSLSDQPAVSRNRLILVVYTLAIFVSGYRGVVHDLEALDGKRKVLKDRKDKAADAAKKAEIEKEQQAADAEEKQVLAEEKQLLERARVPARDAAAKRFETGGR